MKKYFLFSAFAIPLVCGSVFAQSSPSAPGNARLALLPALSLGLEYRTYPVYYQQSIDDAPQYSSIEAYVRDEANTYLVYLTKSGTTEKSCYSNSAAAIKEIEQAGSSCTQTPIDYHKPDAIFTGSAAGFAFQDEKGIPIRWRFLFAYQVTAMGSGLTPTPEEKDLTLSYRKRGTVASEGSAVEIGGKVYPVAPWKEISNPPYFIAYHGYYTEGLSIGSIRSGSSEWHISPVPGSQSGASSTGVVLASADRNQHTFVGDGGNGKGNEWHLISTEKGRKPLSVAIRSSDSANSIQTVSVGDLKSDMKITFHPALTLLPLATGSSTSQFMIDQDGQRDVAHGTVALEQHAGGYQLVWSFGAPDWARTRQIHQDVSISGDTLTLTTK